MSRLELHAAAARAGGHCWVERRLFERLGAGAAGAAAPAVVRLLDAHAQHAAWRAAQWWDRLPVLAGVDRDALVAPPPGWEALLAELDELDGPAPGPAADDRPRLAVAYRRWLPRLARAYARHLDEASPVSDGPTIRTLRMVLEDVRADWSAGEYRLQDLEDEQSSGGVG